MQRDLLVGVGGLQATARVQHVGDEVGGNVRVVERARVEREELRARFLDDRDLDASDLRQPLAFHRRSDRADGGVRVRRRLRKRFLPIAPVRL
jgi:hypothetical protein